MRNLRSSDKSEGNLDFGSGITRRAILRRSIALAALSPLIVSLLTSCADDDGDQAPSDDQEGDDTELEGDGDELQGDDNGEQFDVDEAAEASRGGELVIGLASEPTSLDPHRTGQRVAQQVMQSIYDCLVLKDEDGTFHPALAASWETSSDGTSMDFIVREDVVFHDGSPLNVDAVKFSFDRVLDPDTTPPLSRFMAGTLESVDVIDESTVRFNFERPFAPFMDGVGQSFLAILSPSALEEAGDEHGRRPIGTGPYRFVEWAEGSHITLERNDDYSWSSQVFDHTGPPRPDSLTWRIVPETGTRIATVETGELLITEGVPEDDVERLRSDGIDVIVFPAPGFGDYIHFNTLNSPTDELEVRQALNYSIDRDELNDGLFAGLCPPMFSPLRPNVFGYWEGSEEIGYSYDPERSRELLEQAGWSEGSNGIREKDGRQLELDWPVSTFQIGRRYAEAIQQQARQVGIHLELNFTEFALHQSLLDEEDGYHLHTSRMTWPDPDMMFSQYHSSELRPGGNNRCRITNPEMDEALERGRESLEPDDRLAAYEDVQRIIIEESYTVSLCHPVEVFAHHASVHGLRIDPISYMWVYEVWIEA
jgi:peptide/nickel transport system substrate-binding protein